MKSQPTMKFGAGGWQTVNRKDRKEGDAPRPKGGMNLWTFLTSKLLKREWGTQKTMDINAIMYRQKKLVRKARGEKSDTDYDNWSFEEDSQNSINIIKPPQKQAGWANLR